MQTNNFGKKLLLLILFQIFLAASLLPQAFAIPKINTESDKNSQYIINADQVDADRIKNIITASGDVEVIKGMNVVYADKIVYERNHDRIRAIGHIKIKNLEAGIVRAKEAEVSNGFTSGKFIDTKIIFNDGSYMQSSEVIKESSTVTKLLKPLYSICPNDEIAADNSLAGKNRNMASIRSNQTVIDRGDGVSRSKHAVLLIYDVPILYTPYLKTTLASKQKESGFLTPSYAKSSNLGLGIRTPYYVNIARNADLTITPFLGINTEQIIINNEFRHKVKYGEYKTNLEVANNKLMQNTTVSNTTKVNKKYRGSLKGWGKFDFSKDVGASYELNLLSDYNYLKDYRFNYLAYTTSTATVNSIHGRDYYALNLTKLQELEYESNIPQEPIAPEISTYTTIKQKLFKGELGVATNTTAIYRSDGMQYRRLSVIPKANIPFNLQGNLFNISASVQNDLYSIENNYRTTSIEGTTNNSSTYGYDKTIVNYRPEVELKWRLPLMKKSKTSTFLIEPMASIVNSSTNKNYTELPNEDSNDSELGISNIFVTDRISGYDRNESGSRVNYGLKSSYFNKYGEFGLTAGQSYLHKSSSQDINIAGFSENSQSNIVGQAFYKAQKYFSLLYFFQLDQSNYRNDVNQVTTNFNTKKFILGADYLLIRRNSQNSEEIEQMTARTTINLTKKWSSELSMTKDIIKDRVINRGISLYRDGCCTTFGVSLIEINPNDSVKPQQTYNMYFSFKNL